MRIRKRKIPFPLSSLSPVPLSDPQFSDHLQLQSNPLQNISPKDDKASNFGPRSSDQPNLLIGDGGNGQDSADYGCKQEQKKKEGREDHKEGEKSNDSRKENFLLGAKTQTIDFQESSSLIQDGKWCEGERAFPVKKRRGSSERRSNGDISIVEKDKKMKTTMNKNYMQEGEGGEDYKIKSKENFDKSGSSCVKKKVRGGALMEGSRCSRVNGRGWRCCQPTLVGYSLCEHHLGKGRLRSITSVRSRSIATNSTPKMLGSQPLPSPSFPSDHKLSEEEKHQQQPPPLLVPKKKQKLGMVKARSISSLLRQSNDAIGIAERIEE